MKKLITYAEENIDKQDVELFKEIQQKLAKIDRFPIKVTLTCHMLARAISELYGLKVVTGYWRPGWEHSWILTISHNIIDVYPWCAVGGPMLLARAASGSQFYYEANVSPDNGFPEDFLEAVKTIKECLS